MAPVALCDPVSCLRCRGAHEQVASRLQCLFALADTEAIVRYRQSAG